MEPENLSLVALTPAEMPVAQTALVEWCTRKIAHHEAEVADLRANHEIAKRNRWGSRGALERTIKREEERIAYYGRIKAALDAGYLIIPNFPIDAFAVRVKEGSKPRWMRSNWRSNDLVDAKPTRALPAGSGEYVDDQKVVEEHAHTYPDGKTKTWLTTNEFDREIDFPLVGIKPVILEAAERALAARIFDRIGVVQQRRKEDPILVGQIERKNGRYGVKTVTFFIAWWLNTEDL